MPIEETIDAAIARFSARWPERELVYRRAGEPLVVQADPAMLRRVIDNLLDNARKYSPETASIEICVAREADRARDEVIDHGVGIAHKKSKRRSRWVLDLLDPLAAEYHATPFEVHFLARTTDASDDVEVIHLCDLVGRAQRTKPICHYSPRSVTARKGDLQPTSPRSAVWRSRCSSMTRRELSSSRNDPQNVCREYDRDVDLPATRVGVLTFECEQPQLADLSIQAHGLHPR